MNVEAMSLQDFRGKLEQLSEGIPGQDMSDEERVRRAKRAFMQKLNGHRAVDLDSCLQCGMCAEACHFYEATQNERYAPVYKYRPLRRFYRREMSPMRWFYRPFTRDITAADLKEWQHLVYDACTGCGRCDMICPMGIKISAAIRVVRHGLAAAGYVPPEMRVLRNEQRDQNTLFGVGAEQLKALVEKLGAQGISVPLDREQADVMLLTTAVEVLLFPDAFAATARILNKSGADWTIRSDVFEAANVGIITGDDPTMSLAIRRIVDKAKACGVKTVLMPESGHAYQTLRWEGATEMGGALPFETLSIPEFISGEVQAGRLNLKAQSNGASVTYHDPCRLSRKGGVMQQPRDVLAALGLDVRETPSNQRENYCCGGGCGEYVLSGAADLRQKAFEIKRREFEETGADAVVTGCANCRINLLIGAENSGWETPVTSLVETVAANLAD
ncbi:MAG: (Fe-S)-binding protein [Gammaproteobacteria bacterium]|jgi:Fe-S oxidoreductase|nr:(Fe-S)-binding protein [Gammaproteobacteria bacterium]MDH3749825.1 (Fe-S)-binding protein [Gammaproteobacteria bacterium]MDH3804274.1 (Fe-S)-binding protein [Gammaproteobacteria bacterium]